MSDTSLSSPDTIALKHLDVLQSVVTRMAANSFLIKGWAVTLVSALFALGAKDGKPIYAALAIYPALAFWGLDAYYLMLERTYRLLWIESGKAHLGQESPIVKGFKPPSRSYWDALFSAAVWPLYVSILAVAALIMLRTLLAR